MAKKKPKINNDELLDSEVVKEVINDNHENEKPRKFIDRFKKKNKEQDEEPVVKINGTFKDNSFLNDVRPREGYYFHSDYFNVDDKVAKIVTFVNKGFGKKLLPIFWGINLIPQGLGQDVTVVLVQSVDKMSESWIEEHQSTADKVSSFNDSETSKSVNRTEKKKAKSTSTDIDIIAEEIIDGAAYSI